jgi:isopentenyldiphosphate isomerase
VRSNAVPTGVVTYVGNNRKNDTFQPVVLYVFDLEVSEDVVLRPQDDEVEAFKLMSVEEVREAMMRWEFKPNCCLVMIDFFVRHGIITQEDEGDYLELIMRLRRPLPVPLGPSRA